MTHTLTDVSGVGPSMAETLVSNKIDSIKKLAKVDIKDLMSIPGIGETTGRSMIESAGRLHGKDELPAEGKKDKKSKKNKPVNKGKKDKKGKRGKNKKGKKSKK